MRLEQVDHNPFLLPVDHNPFARKLYLIRHGATALNSESGGVDRIRAWSNVPLSEEGREEALKLGEKLKDSGLQVLYYSTLDRAHETAKAIARTTGAQLVPDQDLKPWGLGDFTGKESKAVHPKLCEYAIERPNEAVPGGGESFNQFKLRVFSGIRRALDQTPEDVLFGIVTHHRVERLVKAWIKEGEKPDLALDMDEMFKFGEKTGHAEIIEIDPQKLGG